MAGRATITRQTQRIAQGLIVQSPDTSNLLSIQDIRQQLEAMTQLIIKLQGTMPPTTGTTTNPAIDFNTKPLTASFINKSGALRYGGDVLIQDTTTNEGVTTTNTVAEPVWGVAAGDGTIISTVYVSAVAQIGSAIVANIGGVAPVRVNTLSGRLSCKRGDYLITDNISGCARVGSPTDSNIFAIAAETQAHGYLGIINALILPPVKTSGGGGVTNPLILTDPTTGYKTTLTKSASGHALDITTELDITTPGAVGNALSLDGVSKHVSLASMITMPTDAALSFWAKPTFATSTWCPFLGHSSGSYDMCAYIPSAYTWIDIAGVTMTKNLDSLSGTWIHWIVNKTGNDYNIIVNNASQGIITNTAGFTFDWLGAGYNGKLFGHTILDEVAYFTKTLDAGEIAREWAGGAGYMHTGAEAGLAHCWQMNQLSGTSVPDLMGTNNGTAVGIIDADWVSGKVPGSSPSVTKTTMEVLHYSDDGAGGALVKRLFGTVIP